MELIEKKGGPRTYELAGFKDNLDGLTRAMGSTMVWACFEKSIRF